MVAIVNLLIHVHLTALMEQSWLMSIGISQKINILFTTGEGEGGYFYNTEDNSVWDCGLGEQHLLGTDQLRHWSSFYKFMVWYLTPDES